MTRLQPAPPGHPVTLDDAAARAPEDDDKGELERRLHGLTERLDQLQAALFAEGKQSLLVMLQGRDTSGKDGVIRHVFGPLDPQGVTVTSFKVPTALELAHDFLWRVHQAVPPRGALGVFNRSHYEDVLVVRVNQLVPESVWRPRYEQINRFEEILAGNGMVVLKFLLYISREEQRRRLLARLEEPTKYWKFAPGDLVARERWDDYTRAYEEMVLRTSSVGAPWYLVPADRKPVRDVLIAEVVVEALERMDPKYPGPPADLEKFLRALA